ncbi:MAG: tetratricopeptide repeat protein [Bacteroidia bacterium]|nr:tetratricopeptide repeat protein [Bacteroidia bacterium]
MKIRFIAMVLLGLIGCKQAATDRNSTRESADSTTVVNTIESPEEAIARLTKLIKDNPKDYGLLQERALTQYARDSFSLAIRDIDLALKMYPQSPDLHYLKGVFTKTTGDSTTAIEEFQQSVAMGTQNPEAHYELGQQFFFRQNYDAALKAYQTAASLNKQEPLYVFAQAFLEESRGKPSKALNLYRQTLEVDSLFVKALTQIHDVYFQTFKSPKDAKIYNDRLLAYFPSHPLGQFQRGTRQLSIATMTDREAEEQRFAEAINGAVEAFTIAINSDPNYFDAYFSRGFSYILGGQRIDLATSDFEKCLALNPNHAQTHFWLGSIQEKYQDFASALSYYETALRLSPGEQDFIDAVNELKGKVR